jgi:hypothetical protein
MRTIFLDPLNTIAFKNAFIRPSSTSPNIQSFGNSLSNKLPVKPVPTSILNSNPPPSNPSKNGDTVAVLVVIGTLVLVVAGIYYMNTQKKKEAKDAI